MNDADFESKFRDGFVFEPLSEKWLPVLPCPFCGQGQIKVEEREGIVLVCQNCGASGPEGDYREERSIPTWNNRYNVKPSQPLTPERIAEATGVYQTMQPDKWIETLEIARAIEAAIIGKQG